MRRRVLVNPAYQLRTLLPVGLFALAFAALAGGLVVLPMYLQVKDDPNPDIRVLLEHQFFEMLMRLAPVLLFSAFLSAAYALYLSQRVAGSLLRLERVLEKMAQGNFESLTFRCGDPFREFANLANQLGKRTDLLVARNRDALVRVQARLNELVLRLEKEIVPKWQLQETLNALLTQVNRALEKPPGG